MAINNARLQMIVMPRIDLKERLQWLNSEFSSNFTIMILVTDKATVLYNDTIPEMKRHLKNLSVVWIINLEIFLWFHYKLVIKIYSSIRLPVSISKKPWNWHKSCGNSLPLEKVPIMSMDTPAEDIKKSLMCKLSTNKL